MFTNVSLIVPVPEAAGLVILATRFLTHWKLVPTTFALGVKVNKALLHTDFAPLLSNTGCGLTVTRIENGLPEQPAVTGTAKY